MAFRLSRAPRRLKRSGTHRPDRPLATGRMMKFPLILALALLLPGCGPKALSLPEDPIDRAASCGVVAAVQARAATADVKASLPFDSQGHILHYALLAASEGGSYEAERAVKIND